MIEIWEDPESSSTLSTDGTSFTVRFYAKGSDNKLAVIAEILAADSVVPGDVAGIPRSNIQLDTLPGHTSDWKIEVLYSTQTGDSITPTEIGQERESFTTSGGSIRLTQALEHIGDYARLGETAPNHKGAINVTEDGVQGTEVGRPQFSMKIDKIFDDADINQSFRQKVFKATNTVNSDDFRGFKAGELYLEAVDVDQRDAESWFASYRLIASENLENISIDGIDGINKEGHHYLWAGFETVIEDEGTDNARAVKRVSSVHIERVYNSTIFTGNLGI